MKTDLCTLGIQSSNDFSQLIPAEVQPVSAWGMQQLASLQSKLHFASGKFLLPLASKTCILLLSLNLCQLLPLFLFYSFARLFLCLQAQRLCSQKSIGCAIRTEHTAVAKRMPVLSPCWQFVTKLEAINRRTHTDRYVRTLLSQPGCFFCLLAFLL